MMRAAIKIGVGAMWLLAGVAASLAHDTWLETHTNVVRTGDAVHVRLLLGNHGNDHRDYKIAGKASLEHATVEVRGPDGKTLDLKDLSVDEGYAPNEGHWSAKYVPAKSGLYSVVQTDDSIYRTTRSIKTARTYFVASPKLDYVQPDKTAFETPTGRGLELAPTAHPVLPMGPGTPIRVRLLFDGRPLANEVVSFIPRGDTLREGFDERYERRTDAEGKCSFTPKTGNWYLIAAHRLDEGASGDGYEKTKYSATLNVFVPEFCSCCE